MNLLREIAQGEGQCLEFKFRVDSQRKIAKTLVSFANSDGGRMLIGVKDNGVVAGARGEEELHMIQGAADLHTRPPVPFTAYGMQYEGKVILVIDILPSAQKPHEAHEEVLEQKPTLLIGASKTTKIAGRAKPREWCAYFRQGAANYRANGVLWEYWRREKEPQKLHDAQQAILHVLKGEEGLSVAQIIKRSGMEPRKVEQVLAAFIAWQLVVYQATERGIRFKMQ